MSDLAKGNFNDFNGTVNGHKYTFQAVTKAERDGWLVAIDSKIADAKSDREAVTGSEAYKGQLEKYCTSIPALSVAERIELTLLQRNLLPALPLPRAKPARYRGRKRRKRASQGSARPAQRSQRMLNLQERISRRQRMAPMTWRTRPQAGLATS